MTLVLGLAHLGLTKTRTWAKLPSAHLGVTLVLGLAHLGVTLVLGLALAAWCDPGTSMGLPTLVTMNSDPSRVQESTVRLGLTLTLIHLEIIWLIARPKFFIILHPSRPDSVPCPWY